MKKLYTLTLMLLVSVASFAQVILSENFGTPTANTPIDTHTFQSEVAPIVYSGTASVRTTAQSTGYVGASGAGNIYFGDTQTFMIEGINTSMYNTNDLELSFGMLQEQNIATPNTNFKVEVSTNGTTWTPLTYTRQNPTGWELVTIESGIPSATNVRIRFTRTSTSQYRIDDVKISSVSANCTFELGQATTECINPTLGTNDTYTVTLPFTGGNNGTYTVEVTTGSGTVGGANPSTTAAGNIVISGVAENTNITVKVIGTVGTEQCIVTMDIVGGSCEPINTLPYYENFDYTAGSNLGDSQKWQSVNSGDAIVVVPGNLSYTGITSTGNSVSFSGSGAEAFTPFTELNVTESTTGSVYARFLMNVTEMTNVTAEGTETAIAALTGDLFTEYNARLFFKKVGTQYQIGLDAVGTTTTNYTSTSYNVGDVVYVIMGYDVATNAIRAWINPTVATFTVNTPATLTATPELPGPTEDPYTYNGFLLRQDTDVKTPTITFDELKIAASLEALLSTTSVDAIEGLTLYPNPATGDVITITSAANAAKTVAIYDMVGKQVVNTVTNNGTVNVSDLSAGMYIVNITEEGKTATRKLVVR